MPKSKRKSRSARPLGDQAGVWIEIDDPITGRPEKVRTNREGLRRLARSGKLTIDRAHAADWLLDVAERALWATSARNGGEMERVDGGGCSDPVVGRADALALWARLQRDFLADRGATAAALVCERRLAAAAARSRSGAVSDAARARIADRAGREGRLCARAEWDVLIRMTLMGESLEATAKRRAAGTPAAAAYGAPRTVGRHQVEKLRLDAALDYLDGWMERAGFVTWRSAWGGPPHMAAWRAAAEARREERARIIAARPPGPVTLVWSEESRAAHGWTAWGEQPA